MIAPSVSAGFQQAGALIAVVALAMSAPSCATSQRDQKAATTWQVQIAAAAEGELKRSGAPSLQIAIGNRGDIVFEGAYGLADTENDVRATPRTLYRTASAVKWMTATEAMRLVDAKKLDLDVPIQTYCPQFSQKPWPITTRQLLTHTSGIRHDPTYDAQLAAAKSEAERSQIERRRSRDFLGGYTRYTDVIAALDNFKDDPLLFEPGTKWSYASPGYRVLACVLQGAAGRNYATMMHDDIFALAGMHETVPDDAWAIIPHRAALYGLRNGQLQRAEMRDVSENLPAGGYLSTASDLVVFAQAFGDGRLVSSNSISLMSQPYHVDSQAAGPSRPLEVPSGSHYGYGVMLFPASGETWIGHTGRQAGASSIVVLTPDRKVAIAVMTNTRDWDGGFSFAMKLRDIVERGIAPPR